MNELEEINQTAKKYIVLASPNQKTVNKLFEWWNN